MPGRPSEIGAAWPRRVLVTGLACDVALALAYLSLTLGGLSSTRAFRVLDLNMEANLPAWYESSKLLLIGIVFLALAVRPLASDARLAPLRRLSGAFALLFVYLSADEGGGIHERITGLLGGLPFVPSIDGNGVWIFLYAAAGLVGLFLARRRLLELARLWPRPLTIAVAGLAMMATGGVLLEALSYFVQPTAALYPLEVAAEELLEMVGSSVVLYAAICPLAAAVSALGGGVSDGFEGADPPSRWASGTG